MVAVVASTIVLVATDGHPGVTYDSVAYASTSRVLHATGRWSFSSLWAPGLPFLLTLVGTDHGALVLNLIALAANLICVYAIGRLIQLPRLWAVALVSWVGLSVATTSVYAMLFSEPLFVLCCNLAVVAMLQFGRAPATERGRWVAALVLACNVASLLRFASPPLIAAAALAYIMTTRGALGWLRASVRGLLLAIASSATYLAVVTLRLIQEEPPLGPRYPSPHSAVEVGGQFVRTLLGYLINREVATGVLGPLLALVLTSALLWRGRRALADATPAVIWVAMYVAFIGVSEVSTWVETANFRLLAPVHACGAALLFAAVREALGERRWLLSLGAVAASCLLVSTLAWAAAGDWFSYNREIADLRASATRIDRMIPADAPIVSDDPAVVAMALGRDEIRGFPDAGAYPTGSPYYYPADRFAGTRRGDWMVLVDGGETSADPPSGVLVMRGAGFSVYRVTASVTEARVPS